jgi:signal transduction histidine kinase
MRAVRLFTVGVISWLLAVVNATPAAQTGSAHLGATVLTNAAQIRSLTAAQTAQALPVELRGVVVDESHPRERAVILASQGTGLYLLAATNLFAPYHRRDFLVIKGVTSAGEFAPCVLTTEARKLGEAPVPAPRPVTYQQLITGALDAQFVEITGVVRQCWPAADEDTWRIVLAADGGTVPIRIPIPQDPQIEEDAEVTVHAVCLYLFNKKRQALSPVLQVPRGVSVRILKRSPENPYAAPAQSATSLLQFSSEIPFGHRIHVQGTVTCSQSSSFVWIRDETSGLRLQIGQTNDLLPGDEIDALGFPSSGSPTPVLENAIYRKTGKLIPPAPLALTNAFDAYDQQDELVGIHGMLLDIQPVLDGTVLTLEHQGEIFKAMLKQPLKRVKKPDWQPGSLVQVAGICDVVNDFSQPVMGIWHPRSFQLLLRGPADVTILKRPSWWTAGHIILLLGVLAGGSLAATAGVIFAARRRLLEQAKRRARAEAEFAAILSERNRLAREIHDTLAQGFTATLLQLQLVKFHATRDFASMSQHLERSEQMIRESLQEARNSIWQMRAQVLETGSLAGALRNILTEISAGTASETHFEVAGRERRLSPSIEDNVLRLGQEAITNAVKHAHAGQINVLLDYGEEDFSLMVADDGCGFDPAHPPPSEGGFGLVGMHERARELNGRLDVRSAPDQGTAINLRVPLLGESKSPRTGE